MPKLSFETDGEKKMYDRGRREAIEDLFKDWYFQLQEREAFPDKDAEAFMQWGIDILMPALNKFRGQDDLFDILKNI